MDNDFPRQRAVDTNLKWICAGLVSSVLGTGQAMANDNPCLSSAQLAAQEFDVPYEVLVAIAKTETGQTKNGHFAPWPWTINAEGQGYWYDTQAELLDAALGQLASGQMLFDLGCFQINYRWHNENFVSLDAMIDPHQNARYAAKFLKSLYGEFEDWTLAAGAYHSRTEKFAQVYRTKFERHLSNSKASPKTVVQHRSQPQHRTNSYPLLQLNQAGVRLGSLVPIRAE